MSADLWQRGCERLAAELPEQQFNTWIRPLVAAEVADAGDSGAIVTLRVPNRFKLDWIRNQYGGRIEALLAELAGKPVRLEIMLTAREVPPSTAAAAVVAGLRPLGSAPARAAVTPQALPSRSRLNVALTFDTLVPGRANQMARTAALHVAGAPGQMYNPLFIYGGVGLGKTHLIHAVGNALLADKPDARILYLHAEQFITDVVRTTSARPSTS